MFHLPDKTARMLRADLEAARAAWIEDAAGGDGDVRRTPAPIPPSIAAETHRKIQICGR